MCALSAKNIKLYGSWSSSELTFSQIAWFLGNNGALSKFKYWILHYLSSIIKL